MKCIEDAGSKTKLILVPFYFVAVHHLCIWYLFIRLTTIVPPFYSILSNNTTTTKHSLHDSFWQLIQNVFSCIFFTKQVFHSRVQCVNILIYENVRNLVQAQALNVVICA